MRNLLIIGLLSIALSGCHAPKTVPYMTDAELLNPAQLATVNPIAEPTIMPGDLLNIEVTASTYEAVAPFNKGRILDAEGGVQTLNNNNQEYTIRYYLVDVNGDIDFPLVGKIHVGGIKKSEVVNIIVGEIYPRYIKERPTVDVRIMNFCVTVVGQVKNPGIIKSDNERLNIFEAIAKAGDLDIKGERETVKIVRTFPDGKREVAVVNLHTSDILTSPYYNLQQNDMIYVVPNRSAAQGSWQMPTAVTTATTIVGSLSGILALILTLTNL